MKRNHIFTEFVDRSPPPLTPSSPFLCTFVLLCVTRRVLDPVKLPERGNPEWKESLRYLFSRILFSLSFPFDGEYSVLGAGQ